MVNEELTHVLEPQDIDQAIVHLRMGDGTCWTCHRPIQMSDEVSLLAHATSAGISFR
jgi:hypothetical protein